jgi:hypothetical protein
VDAHLRNRENRQAERDTARPKHFAKACATARC